MGVYCIMNNSTELLPLFNFNVVAVHRVTGKPQFATISAPSQVDADDFVADMQSDWVVIRDNADLHDKADLEMVDAMFNNSPAIRCDHCEHLFPEDEVNNCDRDDPDFHLCGDCQSDLQAKWMD